MWVIKVSDFLNLSTFPTHQDLQAGWQVAYARTSLFYHLRFSSVPCLQPDHFRTHFVECHLFLQPNGSVDISPRWLSQKHPDPFGAQILVLKRWLLNLIDRQGTAAWRLRNDAKMF